MKNGELSPFVNKPLLLLFFFSPFTFHLPYFVSMPQFPCNVKVLCRNDIISEKTDFSVRSQSPSSS